jgi:cbb3-type cytochrome oxidase subunit 3
MKMGEALTWIELALILFFLVFVVIVVRVVIGRRGKYDEYAQIPLDDEEAPKQ